MDGEVAGTRAENGCAGELHVHLHLHRREYERRRKRETRTVRVARRRAFLGAASTAAPGRPPSVEALGRGNVFPEAVHLRNFHRNESGSTEAIPGEQAGAADWRMMVEGEDG